MSTRPMAGVDPLLDGYFLEARSWDLDRAMQNGRSVRTAWRVAAAGWLCAITTAIALVVMMPLKRVDPFLIRVDRSTGIVDVVPVYTGVATADEAVTRYFLSHYVTVCERFNLTTAESDYEECGAFHGASRNQAWAAQWSSNNPASPLNVHRDGSSVRVQVESVSFFKRATGMTDLAQVRYLKAGRTTGAATESVSHWIANIQYVYTAPSATAQVRRWNPLGFKIVDWSNEVETLTTPDQALPAPTQQDPQS